MIQLVNSLPPETLLRAYELALVWKNPIRKSRKRAEVYDREYKVARTAIYNAAASMANLKGKMLLVDSDGRGKRTAYKLIKKDIE